MELSLKNRVVLSLILPTEGSYDKLIIRKDVMKKVELTQEEVTKFEVKQDPTTKGIVWKDEEAAKFEIDFTEAERNYVNGILSEMNTKEKLNLDTVELFTLFK